MPAVTGKVTSEPGAQPLGPSLLHEPATSFEAVNVGQAEWTDSTVSSVPHVDSVRFVVHGAV